MHGQNKLKLSLTQQLFWCFAANSELLSSFLRTGKVTDPDWKRREGLTPHSKYRCYSSITDGALMNAFSFTS